jgi:hypothetical protein
MSARVIETVLTAAIEKLDVSGDASGWIFSCNAVNQVEFEIGVETTLAYPFLRSMGVDTGCPRQFDDIPIGPKRQYARALWLTWAALMAREGEL